MRSSKVGKDSMLPGVASSKNSSSSNVSNGYNIDTDSNGYNIDTDSDGYNIDTDSDKCFDEKLGLLRKRTYIPGYLRI